MSAPGWLTTLFCPLLGAIISNAVGLAPVRAVLEARRKQNLGALSPIPFALIVNCCLGWTMYGVFKGDYYIFFSNCFSLIVGIALCLTAIHILETTQDRSSHEEKIRIRVEAILMISSCLWLFIVFIAGIVLKAPQYFDSAILLVGSFCIISSLVFYASPLINMVEIVKTKDSSSLYVPAIIINGVNCTLWFFYGLIGIDAVIVWLPNIIGLVLVAIELAMCCIYPPLRHKSIGLIGEGEPLNDFAVYSSSRHMSTADFTIPMVQRMSLSFRDDVLGSTRSDRANTIVHNPLFTIKEKNEFTKKDGFLFMSEKEENMMPQTDSEDSDIDSNSATAVASV